VRAIDLTVMDEFQGFGMGQIVMSKQGRAARVE
jgi:hypothetical protein